jgi:uncharacterized OB-fold protein
MRQRAALAAAVAVASLSLLAAGAQAADMNKVLRTPVQSAEKGFDCAWESDEMTGTLCDHIFDSLLQYDHLARPIKLQPRAAAALPEISADGRTYTLKLKRGIYFTDDPAFKGKKRELVASDYVYSLKRLLDPQLKAQWQFLVEGKLIGGRTGPGAKVYIPPRGACPTDGLPTNEQVELPDKGTVTTFCVVNVPFLGQRIKPPYIAAYVLLDGADIAFLHLILECDPVEVRMGMRVEAVWKPQSEWGFTLENIDYFRPSGEPDAEYDTYKQHL